MTNRVVLIATVLWTILAAGCARGESAPTPAASRSLSTATAPPTEPAVSETNACAPQGDYHVKINGDGITCDNAYKIAARYDRKGEKYQKIDAAGTWTCYAGTAESRPLIFQCVSGQDTEFGVYPTS